jgi:hypothetical protein
MIFSSTGTRSRIVEILGRHEQQVRIVERRLHALGVGDHVRRQVALVEAHALDEIHLHAEGLALFDGDDTVLADLVDRLGDHVADLLIGRRDRSHLGNLLGGIDLDRVRLDRLDRCGHTLLDAPLEAHRVGAGRQVAQTFADHRPGEDRGRRRAVTGDVVGLLGDFLDELGADPLVRILELDVLGDRDAVVGDRGGAPLLVQHDIAALRAERDAHGVGQLVHPGFEGSASLGVECDHLRHLVCPPLDVFEAS